MNIVCRICTLILFLSIFGMSCTDESNSAKQLISDNNESTYFQLLDSAATGISFINLVEDQKDFNILTYRNFYNGGGVAIGDINNDGLSDIYFTSNLNSNKLYLNQGNFSFKDISHPANVKGQKAWSTGVTMADVNGDGFLDIYVSNSGDIKNSNKENELFINNGDLTFTEKAEEYNLNNEGYSTQAAFFDYDSDGDLDCYLLNNSFKDPAKIELHKSMRDTPDNLAGDKLYRNDGNSFTDVTTESGIYSSQIGFGLGTCIGDINQDNLPDIYVSNDFWERDYLYINKGDGTFSEELKERIAYTPISSMGGDIADLNNDGYPEIISTDMLPADNYRLKAMTTFDLYHLEDLKYRSNYHYQIGQNCLQLNDGSGSFQEISMMSNMAATDWSWGALIFDFENDGDKDVFISNGIQNDLMSMDFRDNMQNESNSLSIKNKDDVDYLSYIDKMPSTPLKNYAFSNSTGNEFTNKAEELGLDIPSFSNGSAYADLDNDGDLDLVVNNVNQEAFVYENKAEKSNNNYIKVKFKGYAQNPYGIGAHVKIKTKTGIQVLENFNTRGFESAVEPFLLFGLGKDDIIENVKITWPDHSVETLHNIKVNQMITVEHKDAKPIDRDVDEISNVIYSDITSTRIDGNHLHIENRYNDFDHELLLLSMQSQETPRILKGDVNGDSLEDFIVLSAKDDDEKLFIQEKSGIFKRKELNHFSSTKEFESESGVLFDRDNDGDLDLMLGAGGNEYQRGGKYFILRYFENDGHGNFTVDNSSIPQIIGNFSAIEASDFDNDGDVDLYFAGRIIPGNYGLPPRSFLMRNDGDKWTDVTPEMLAGPGMITDVSWVDIDGDKDEDLILVGEWMDIKIFKNLGGYFDLPIIIENSSGFWNRIEATDLDNDGDLDFVLANQGLNTKLQASVSEPLSMNVHDFDNNGKSEFIINWYPPNDTQSYPFASKREIIQQLPFLRKQLITYEDYADKTYKDLFSKEIQNAAINYSINTLETSVLWNEGESYSLEALPKEVQVSPMYAIAINDINGDGYNDVWLGGNQYELQPQVGRHNSSKGHLLIGNKNRSFTSLENSVSGISIEGEVRDAMFLKANDKTLLLISRNDDQLKLFEPN